MKGKIKVLIISLLLATFVLSSCGGPNKTTCYWCGQEEECYQYLLQYLDGYNPNGSFKYGYDVKYLYYNNDEEFINLDDIINDLE